MIHAPMLHPALLGNIHAMGCTEWFPVQATTLIPLLKRRDTCIHAPTGSGKTLAYCVPMVQSMCTRVIPQVRGLVIVPTRDLAFQVASTLQLLTQDLNLHTLVIVGKQSFIQEQKLLHSGIDILIATPGRLVDHLPTLCLQYLQYLIIDEMDRLLAQPFHDWSTKLFATIPSTATKVLCSATLTKNPQKLANMQLTNPFLYESNEKSSKYQLPTSLNQFTLLIPASQKLHNLVALLNTLPNQPILCFTSSLAATHRLCRFLQLMQFRAIEFSASIPQHERNTILKQVNASTSTILITSDVMARGIDLVDIHHVINYDAPKYITSYIHRVGRTARAGQSGNAYTFLTPEQSGPFLTMLKKKGHVTSPAHYTISKEIIQSLHDSVTTALDSLEKTLAFETQHRLAWNEPISHTETACNSSSLLPLLMNQIHHHLFN